MANTMQDVATSLGVSVSTVSLALRGNPVVAEATRVKVQREAERLGYVYNRSAANLRTRRRHLVGFVVPDIANPFVAETALGLQEAVSQHDLFVVLANTLEDRAVQTEIIRSLAEERAAGVILIPALGTTAEDLHAIESMSMPTVLMNRPVQDSDLPCIAADDDVVVDIALEHLINEHDVGTLAYFGGRESAVPRIARSSRFSAEVRRLGRSELGAWSVPTAPHAAAAHELASRLLREMAPPEAIICHDDTIAIGVLKALHEAKVSPEECRVVGVDGLAQSSMTSPGLTTVSVHARSMGLAAADHLVGSGGSELVPPSLEIRESCGCRATA